jgi:hypothetical protein
VAGFQVIISGRFWVITEEEISTSFISKNVKAKEQAEVRRRSGRCITGGEDH